MTGATPPSYPETTWVPSLARKAWTSGWRAEVASGTRAAASPNAAMARRASRRRKTMMGDAVNAGMRPAPCLAFNPSTVARTSDLVALQQLAADDHALDLRGALADQQ